MNDQRSAASPPRLYRLLLTRLLRGPLAEAVLGDLEEQHAGLTRAHGRRHADRVYRGQTLRALMAWWQPAAVRERRTSRRRRIDHPRTTLASRAQHEPVASGASTVSLLHDLRLALRTHASRPLFALVVIAILALGIGATTTIYSIVDGVLLRDLPYRDADRLVVVGTTSPNRPDAVIADDSATYPLMGSALGNFLEWRDRTRTLEHLVAAEYRPLNQLTEGGPEPLPSAAVTRDFFAAFGVGPELGRLFVEGDHRFGSSPAGLLSHDAWTTRFGGDPDIVGSTLSTSIGSLQIIGVLPASFVAPTSVVFARIDVWIPLAEDDPAYGERGRRSIMAMGRIAPGSSLAATRHEMWELARRAAEETPEGNVFPDGGRFGAGVNPMHAEVVGNAGDLLWALLGAVSLLLLIACVNVAGLLLSRGAQRARELSIRAALGAGRKRLVRQLLTESLLLSTAAGVLGTGLAFLGVRAFVAASPGTIPRLAEVAIDGRILAFTVLVSLLTGASFGTIPALRLSRSAPAEALRTGASTAGIAGRRFLSTLVAAEIALALVLSVGAGLLMHSMVRLNQVDTGFDDTEVLAFSVSAPGGFENGDATLHFRRQLQEAIAALPGVARVATASNAPLERLNWRPGVYLEGESAEAGTGRGVDALVVSQEYFDLLGIQLLAGRVRGDDEAPRSPRELVVNRAFVDDLLGGRDAIGTEFRMTAPLEDVSVARIVGVVEDVRQTHPSIPPAPAVYTSAGDVVWPGIKVLVRMQPGGTLSEAAVRGALKEVDASVPVRAFSTLRDRRSDATVEPRFYARLLSAFAGLALLLASAGIWATTAFSVGQRTREMGIRMALGARAGAVRGLVVRQGAWTIGCGVAAGVVGAWLVTGVLADLLYAIGPHDAATFAATALLFAAVALVAAWVPASRATRIDVLEALRGD